MDDSDCADCRCSNISIMQLFHELKQRFPTVPDQIVSKVIQQNFHDKTACETILQKESHSYVQCYPGALISGDGRPVGPSSPLSGHCSAQPRQPIRRQLSNTSTPCATSMSAREQLSQRNRGLNRQRAVDCAEKSYSPESESPKQVSNFTKPNVTQQSNRCVVPRQQTGPDVSILLPHTPTSDSKWPTAVCSASTGSDDVCTTPPEMPLNNLAENDSSICSIPLNQSELSENVEIPDPIVCNNARSRPLSLGKKLQLAKIPLSQLVREAKERHQDHVAITHEDLQETQPCVSPKLIDDKASSNLVTPDVRTSVASSKTEIIQDAVKSKINDITSKPTDLVKYSVETSQNVVPNSLSKPLVSHGNEVVSKPPRNIPCNCLSSPESSSLVNDLTSPTTVLKSEPSATPINISPSNLPHTVPPPPPPPPSPVPPQLDPSRHRLAPPPSEPLRYNVPRPRTLNVPQESAHPQDYQVAVECLVCPGDVNNRQRSFTSVNLTLRPPSTETTLPIEISSGQSLTYTTARFDKRQGYKSQLQIRIGRAGGMMTASRSRVSSPMNRAASRSPCRAGLLCHSKPHLRALLQKQRNQKDLLARELHREKEKLCAMRFQIFTMQEALSRKPSRFVLSRLKSEIEQLRNECERLTTAVDLYSGQGNFLLGETNEDFYRNIYTGQRQQRGGWSCRVCTFRNHPLLSVCEECEMPRLTLGTASSDHLVARVSNPLLPNNNSSCAAEETSTSVSRTIAPLQER